MGNHRSVFDNEECDDEDYDEEFEDMIENCSPDNYFGDKHVILTLDDTRDYEHFLLKVSWLN